MLEKYPSPSVDEKTTLMTFINQNLSDLLKGSKKNAGEKKYDEFQRLKEQALANYSAFSQLAEKPLAAAPAKPAPQAVGSSGNSGRDLQQAEEFLKQSAEQSMCDFLFRLEAFNKHMNKSAVSAPVSSVVGSPNNPINPAFQDSASQPQEKYKYTSTRNKSCGSTAIPGEKTLCQQGVSSRGLSQTRMEPSWRSRKPSMAFKG